AGATAPDAVITSERRPSRFIRPPVTARPSPATARAAPTRAGEVQPHPADRARPPSQAPPALARLNAEWLEAAAIVGASFALAMSSICTGVVMKDPSAPMKVMVTRAGQVLCTVKENVTRAAASRASPAYSVGRRARSVSRSEEHTSELQSRENLVCRLLLEK